MTETEANQDKTRGDTKKIEDWKCHIDGNCLCIVGSGFINLAESDAVFIELTEDQVNEIKELE